MIAGFPETPTPATRHVAHIDLGAGDDYLHLGDTEARTHVRGGSGSDQLVAETEDGPFVPVNVHLAGGPGDDSITGDVSLDSDIAFSGGPGADRADLAIEAAGTPYGTVRADLTSGTLTADGGVSVPLTGLESLGLADWVDPASLVSAYEIRGTDGPNTLVFVSRNALPVNLFGLGANDDLSGSGGDDSLDGGPGRDTADGKEGTNTCTSIEVATDCTPR
ncbi:MAG: hypothetical protein QM747_09180 [Nocardioides sp.]